MYRLPIMSIEGTLLGIEDTKEYKDLVLFCTKNISEGCIFRIKLELGRMWYPEVYTSDRWLAWKLIQITRKNI